MIRIRTTRSNLEREVLRAPFGFKGAYLTEIWQTVARVECESGRQGLGLCSQSVLWSDARVFAALSEAAGNSAMYLMLERGLQLAARTAFSTPLDLLDAILPEVHAYGQAVTGRADLRPTFALNALVALDNAAWQLYAAERGCATFDDMLPEAFRATLGARHREVGCVPLMSYKVPVREVASAVDEGSFLLKIKIGSDPGHDGDPDKMLAWDMARLSEIHAAVGNRETPFTDSGRLPYYLDANGRYDTPDRLMRLLDHAAKIGALQQIVLLEEPFPEETDFDVRGIPVRLAADESAHSETDVRRRIDQGYGAIALKPIAKTLSMSLRMARLAAQRGVPCFCADLTVNPILVDWNKSVAARLAPLPGLKIPVFETNGHQNYRDWARLQSYHPVQNAPWQKVERGLFQLDDDFYARSGGVLLPSEHYMSLVR